MNPKIKISQLPAKGANLAGADLLEIAEFTGTGYVSKSITGQEIIDAAAGAGGVTDVTATAPIESTGGTTPDISIRQSGSLDDGYLSSADWIAFNNKQDALTLTTTGTSGAATLVGSTLNIPQYGGGGASGIHALVIGTGLRTYAGITTGGFSSTAQIVNRMFFYPFIPVNTFTCSNLYIAVAAAIPSALGKILIYSNDNGNPFNLLYESADLDLSTTGRKTTITSFTFNAGTIYWIAYWGNLTPTLYTIPATNVLAIRDVGVSVPSPNSGLVATYTYGSAPTTISGAPGSTNSAVPFIGITIA